MKCRAINVGLILIALIQVFLLMDQKIAMAHEEGDNVQSQSKQASMDEDPLGVGKGIKFGDIDTQPLPTELKARAKKDALDMQVRGYMDVPEEAVSVLENIVKNVKDGKLKDLIYPSLNDIKKGTFKIKPSIIDNTPFKDLKFEGVATGGMNNNGVWEWSSISRYFTMSDETIVELEEWDFAESGGGAILSKEMINEEVNGNPAIFTIMQGPSGKRLSKLSWTTGQKYYSLRVTGDIRQKGLLQKVLELANALHD